MAIDKEINVIISASDKFSGVLGSFAGAAGGIGTLVAGLITTFAAAGAAATAFAYKLGSEVVQEAGEFQNAVFQVGAVAQSAGTSFQDVDDILAKLTNQFPVTGAQAGQAMETIAQLGFGAKESLESLSEASLNLAIATGKDVNLAASVLTSTMNTFNLGVEESDRLVNLFSATQFNSAAALEDFGVGMQYIGPIMSTLGRSIEETAAVLATFRKLGIDASMASAQWRMAMIQLVNPTNDGRKAIAAMGLTVEDLNPAVQTTEQLIGKLSAGQLDLTAAVQIFGKRAGPLMIQVVDKGAEAFGDLLTTVTDTTAGIDAVETKMKSWKVVTENLAGSMSLFKNVIGKDLLQAVIDVIGVKEDEGLRGILKIMTKLEEETHGIGGPLVQVFESLKDALQGVFADEFGGDIEQFYNFLSDTMGVVATLSEAFIQFGVAGSQIFIGLAQSASDWSKNTDAVATTIKVINTVVGALGLVLAGVYDAGQLILYGWQSIGTAISAASAWILEEFYTGLLKAAELIDYLPFVDMEGEIASLRDTTKQMVEEQDKLWADLPDRPAMLTDNVARAIIKVDEYATSVRTAGDSSKVAGEQIDKAAEGVIRFTGSTQDVIDALDALDEKQGVTAETTSELADRFKIVAGQVFDVVTEAEEYADALDRVTPATGEWLQIFDTAGNVLKETWVEFDKVTESTDKSAASAKGMGEEVDDLQRKLDQDMELKILDTDAKIAITRMKTEAESMVEIFKFKAEVDIAQIEAAAQIATAQWDAMAANAETVTAAIDNIAEIAEISPLSAWKIAQAAADIARAQAGLVVSQREYVDAQTAILALQARAIERGEGQVINVEITGDSSTWLAGLLNDLLEQILLKASMEAFTCLCGTPTV